MRRRNTWKTLRTLFSASRIAPSVGRWPLAIALIAGGLLIMTPEAHAAHWQMSYIEDGVTTYGAYSQNWSHSSQSYPDCPPGYSPLADSNPTPVLLERGDNTGQGPHNANSKSSYDGSSASIGGSITFHFKWVQDGPSSGNPNGDIIPPPKMIVLNIWGGAYATTNSPTSQSAVAAVFGKLAGSETTNQSLYKFSRQATASVPAESPWKIPLMLAPGTTELDYTLPVSAQASTVNVEVSSDYNITNPTSLASFGVYLQRKDIGVAISSDIETSWFKKQGDISSLPNAYKKRDPSTHQLINQPNEKAVLVAPNPSDPSKNIWKLQCLRDADGSMTVESAANYTGDRLGGKQSNRKWWGAFSWCKMRANTVGYSIPEYDWSYSGGTGMNFGPKGTGKQEVVIGSWGVGPDADNYSMTGFDLGATISAPSVKSTTFTVNVDDTAPAQPTNLLSNQCC